LANLLNASDIVIKVKTVKNLPFALRHFLSLPYNPRLPRQLSHPTTLGEIIQELGNRVDTRNKQVIPSARASDVQQVPFCLIDFLQIRIVADRFDPLLQGSDFIVAAHDDHGPKLQAFGKVHRAD
jgi:hypothetical protein